MKYLLIALSMFSAFFVVYAAQDPNRERRIKIKCNSENQAINCRNKLKKEEQKSTQDKFGNVGFTGRDSSLVVATFLGSCTKADEVLKAVGSCGVQDCPKIYC